MGSHRIKRNKTALWKRALNLALALVMICGVLGSTAPQNAQASGPVGDVISNYPYNPATGATTLGDLSYDKVDHNDVSAAFQGYEQAYTQAESAKWNGGVATPDHVVLSGSKISFYGYGIMPYMDYVFAPLAAATSSGNSFTLVPDNMNFHSFSESGYLFNGAMTQVGANTYYTGYALILSCANDAGMEENDPSAQNTASLRLYYINNELWNTEKFTPGTVSTTRTLIATIKTGINNLDPTPFRISTEIDPITRAFKVYIDGALAATVAAPIGGANGPQGFGYYTGYYAHNCNILTRIYYEDVTINVEAIPPTPTTSTVNFVEQGTGQVLRIPETEDGVAGQKYKITQPLTVVGKDDGITYYLVGNDYSGASRSDITRYYAADPASNVTTLYYSAPTDLKAQPPRKDARVNGGDWDAGTPDAPVSVVAGDTIDYAITGYAAPVPTAMVMQGSNGVATTTDWLNQAGTSTIRPDGSTLSGPLQKGQISAVAFVDLPDDLTYSAADPASAVKQFLANRSDWAGQPILEAWDATETNTTFNPNAATSRVIAWVTAGGAGGYNLYIGGQAGVLMSASTASSYLFANFSALTTCNLAQLNTASAKNMSYMFSGYSSLTSLDLSNFNTAAVTDMSYMFYNCRSLTSLDLSSFNTSVVTNMSYMFFTCSSLTSLDLSSFNTSAVTNMSYMFNGCSGLTSLDLSNFNTSAVTTMASMFSSCSNLTSLDLRSFNTSAVTSMLYMFYNCSSLTSLDLRSFNTSAVTNMASMFQNCSSLTSLDLRSFNTSAVTSMLYMFYNCSSLTSLDVSNFNTSAVTNMSYMFSVCSSLPSLDLRNFNTSAVTNMGTMFGSCSSLTSLDLRSFNTSAVTNMASMFTSCSSLTSLDLRSFNTSAVTSMGTMFSSCSSLTSLDVSNFNTSAVTNMQSMFSGCFGLSSLAVNHFDVSKVSSFNAMFASCSGLTSLDLSYWALGSLVSATTTNMFINCTNLTTLQLQSALLNQLTTRPTAWFSAGNGIRVTVGSSAAQTWIQGFAIQPGGGIVIGSVPNPALKPQPGNWMAAYKPADPAAWMDSYKPAVPNAWMAFLTDWTLSYKPPTASGSGGGGWTTISDDIPEGLSIKSVSGTESADSLDDAITWQVSGQSVTWSVPNSMLPATVTVTVTVDTGLEDGKTFDNIAYVGSDPTNLTYHKLKGGWRVTEQYLVWNNGPTTTKLDDDYTTLLDAGSSYDNVFGPLDSLAGYTYYGYERVGIDTTVTPGPPPTPIYPPHSADFDTTNSETIQLFYQRKSIVVTINYVDQDGNVLKAPTAQAVPPNQAYYLPQANFNSFSLGSTTWNYFDYAKEAGGAVADVAPPVGPLPLLDAPNYPDASVPTFSAAQMSTDKNITLYFCTTKAVTVHFVEYGKPTNVLHNDESYLFTGSFDPSTAKRSEGDNLPDLLTSNAKNYTYAGHYSLDGGQTILDGYPPTTTDPADITLYFSTNYTIIEKYYDTDGNQIDPVAYPDTTYIKDGGYVFYALDSQGSNPPARIGNYIYVGYKMGNPSNPLEIGYPPSPIINGVYDDYTIIYIYQKAPGTDFTFYKQDKEGDPLEGVIFRLTPQNEAGDGWDSSEATTVASTPEGLVSFKELPDNTYLLEEIKTVPGYALPSGSWKLTVAADADPTVTITAIGSPMAFAHDTDDDLILYNYKPSTIPFSGGWGVIAFVAGSVVLVSLAIWLLISLRKRKAISSAP